MRYHNITKTDMLNGDGLRVVLWFAGCSHHCRNCQNPITWDPEGGLHFDEDARHEIFEELDKEYISGITFSGGDPLYTVTIDGLLELVKEIRAKYPEKTVWLYTGYLWEEICSLELMHYVDVVVDGKFVEELKDNNLPWRGSSNQKVIDVKMSRELGKTVLYE